MALTKEQRAACKRVYDRVVEDTPPSKKPVSYKRFRRGAAPGWDCLMVPFAGMWLGIEKDGYTHS